MKKFASYIIGICLLSACSMFQKTTVETPLVIDQQELIEAFADMAREIESGAWVEAYKSQTGQRPTITTSLIKNESSVTIDIDTLYVTTEINFLDKGTVRVIRGTDEQKRTLPQTLVNGESIDYLLTALISEFNDKGQRGVLAQFQLWTSVAGDALVTKTTQRKIYSK